uniref:RNA polymerase I, II and III n=1 Tax=Amorphochlora amoebiformis TaxID=1561963 RepID=A0A0H5BLU8_9EUKA|nr:RNA polymerase I, II and III [Amorphochlora amoebiformis]
MKKLEKYYTLRKNYLEMLYRRGYNVKESEFYLTYNDYKQNIMNYSAYHKIFKLYYNISNTKEKVCIIIEIIGFVKIKKKFSSLYITKKLEISLTLGSKHIIFIIKKISTNALRALQIGRKNYYFEIFYEYEVLLNVIKHFLVPKHDMLTKEEKSILLKNYMIKESQLPKILKSDPVSRYYGAKKGDVFKITRFSDSIGVYVTFRLCV